MTPSQEYDLRIRIEQWRQIASVSGPQHSYWDCIFDAEALLIGKPTIIRGTPQEVFEALMKIVPE